jgi:CPA2 family monovalent cation:H+ antiporter-2
VAAAINMNAYSDVLVVLGTAGVIVPMVRRWGLSPVLGYLAAGALLGPLGLGSLIGQFPILHWFTLVDAHTVESIGDLGVVFLLFLIGLELSYERLKTMRRLVFGLGGLQVLISTALIAAVAGLAGMPAQLSVILGACLALSSTAIVIEVLSHQGRLSSGAGRTSFAVLLAQDLAVIPILLFITLLGKGSGGSVISSLFWALGNALVAMAAIVLVGRLAFRPVFRLVAAAQASELFVATTLFVIIGAGVVAALAGLSMALGAFVAGLLLAETEFRKAIETTIGPFKGLLLGLFFFSVGMKIDIRVLLAAPLWIAAAVVGLIAVKAAVLAVLARLFRQSWPAAIETGLLLGPGGEFAFVGMSLAASLGLVSPGVASFVLTVAAITMALIPALSALARVIRTRLRPTVAAQPELTARPQAAEGHAIVIGYGRVGQLVCTMLERHDVRFIAIDSNAHAIPGTRRPGHQVYFGDGADPDFLHACGIDQARAVIVTASGQIAIEAIVARVRAMRPEIVIVSRARDAVHAQHLYAIGVTDAVPETLEASLQLSEAALLGLGQAAGRVIASIHDQRDIFRRELQEAAARTGANPNTPGAGLRAKP